MQKIYDEQSIKVLNENKISVTDLFFFLLSLALMSLCGALLFVT